MQVMTAFHHLHFFTLRGGITATVRLVSSGAAVSQLERSEIFNSDVI